MIAVRTRPMALAVVLVATAGCGAGTTATKAGGAHRPMTLRMGSNDRPGEPGADEIEQFARRVDERSNGRIHVEPVWRSTGEAVPDADQHVARRVVSGDLDMGLIPSRAWDTEGVTSLRALNAPFLIQTEELLDKVVTGDLAGRMMAGLGPAGVVGIALIPDELRHPFGFASPLLGPGDYEHKVIRAPTSATVRSMFEAFGATITEDPVNAESQAGMESAYDNNPSGTATANVTFYPKVQSLVVNEDVYGKLDDTDRGILVDAAADTQTWRMQQMPSDATAAERFCTHGGAVVLASDDEVAAIEHAAQPVYDELERDPETKDLVDAIRRLAAKDDSEPSSPTATTCGRPGPVTTASPESSSLNGIYRFEVTDDQLRAAGITDSASTAENHGVFTWTLARRHVALRAESAEPPHHPARRRHLHRWGGQDLLLLPQRPGHRQLHARTPAERRPRTHASRLRSVE